MARINIYKDCESTEPTKTYTCNRLLLNAAQRAAKLAEDMEGKSYTEQIKMIGEIVKAVFPQVTDDEIELIDITELQVFFKDIMKMAAGNLDNAQKNL